MSGLLCSRDLSVMILRSQVMVASLSRTEAMGTCSHHCIGTSMPFLLEGPSGCSMQHHCGA
eukprot:12225010-Ditylum_brightwellii.AAC.1